MLRGNERFLSQAYTASDFIAIQAAFIFSWWLKFKSGLISYEPHLPFEHYFQWGIYYGLINILTGYVLSIYSPKRRKLFSFEFFKVIQINLVSILIVLSLLFFFRNVDTSRHFLAILLFSSTIFTIMYRYFVKTILQKLRSKGFNHQYILILGAGSLGRKFYDNLMQHPEYGFKVVGFLDDYQQEHDIPFQHYKPILGKVDDLEEIVQSNLIDEVIIALPLIAHNKIQNIINVCEKSGIRALIIPDYFDYLPAKPRFDIFAGMPLINVRDIPLDELRNRVIKRAFDISFSLFAIFLTLPLLILIAIAVKLTSPGPVIFKQERVGLNRRNFMMYKFRSMRVLPPGTVDTGWTTANDPRKTKFGSFLRKTSLDELPQFFNVLFGHMSVVGPRPERPYFVEQFKEEIPKYMVKHHIRPGITGWAQASGLRGDTSIEERIRHDIFYIENWTFIFDIKIIFKTIVNGFVNKNAY